MATSLAARDLHAIRLGSLSHVDVDLGRVECIHGTPSTPLRQGTTRQMHPRNCRARLSGGCTRRHGKGIRSALMQVGVIHTMYYVCRH